MLGHGHPRIVAAMKAQLGRIAHVGNLFHNPLQIELAARLVKASFASKVAFVNTGAEANELCIKAARKWGLKKGRHEIVTFEGGFHGRTYGALSATAQRKMHVGLGPLLPGFRYAKYNDLGSAKKAVGPRTCAILVEPMQGEGGVNVGSAEFLRGLRRLCDQKGLLLIVDEIQTGLGRTGKLFCYEHISGFRPDIMSLGKSLGGGLPLSAVLFSKKAEGLIGKGEHGTTMGGNPVACAGGIALLDELLGKKLPARAAKLGAWLMSELQGLKMEFPDLVKEVRGRGLMLGIELHAESAPFSEAAFQKGLILNATAGRVLRMHPPLNVSRSELELGLKILREVFLERKTS
jgi:acetylornithine/succinyldiaminopimelate/putrescine aminotransferase